MNKILSATLLILIAAMLIGSTVAFGKELKPIVLPKPRLNAGKPLMRALKLRSSQRQFSEQKLSPQVLSDLLWAAFGINRPDSGKRTAPSARNWQEIDIYVAVPEGLYLYDAKTHRLIPVFAKDIREFTGEQTFTQKAPVNLIYVADYSRMRGAGRDAKDFYAATDTGFISQNTYLYCASEGLATVVLGLVDKPRLAKIMKLRPDQKIILTQPVAYPAKK